MTDKLGPFVAFLVWTGILVFCLSAWVLVVKGLIWLWGVAG